MKRLFLALTGWLFCLTLLAHVPQFQLQYWFDDNYASNITESNVTGVWQTQMEVSHLSEGFHTLFLHFQDTSGRWSAPRSYLFYQIKPRNASLSETNYTYWFDQDAAHSTSGALSSGPMLLDVNSLHDGFHMLNMQIGSGSTTELRSWLFYKTPHQDSTEVSLNYTCWFDQDAAHSTSGALSSGPMLLDVNSLHDGFHMLNMQIGSGSTTELRSWLFYKIPRQDSTEVSLNYTCWFDQDAAHPTSGTLNSGTMLLDVNGLPDGFHMLNMQIGSGSAAELRSWLFYKIPRQDSTEVSLSYTCWFDQDAAHPTSGTLNSGTMLLDVNGLHDGFHMLNMQIGSGSATVLRSWLFYKTPQQDSTEVSLSYTCWFDQDAAHPTSGTLNSGTMLLDVNSLHDGFHMLNMQIGSGDATVLRSWLFYKVPAGISEKLPLTWHYSIDEVERQDIEMSPVNGLAHLNLDVFDLDSGQHVISYYITDTNNEVLEINSAPFYHPGLGIITFHDENGTVLQCDTLQYGELPTFRGVIPTKEATAQYTYTFAGWSPAVVPVAGNAAYTATYSSVVNKYVVMFLNEDSTLLQIDTLAYGAMPEFHGATPTKQATAQYTYTFNGWNNAIVSVTGSATYLATYVSTTNKYLIIFQDEDGTPLQQDSVEYGALPAYRGTTPTKQSTAEYTYTFAGWNPSVASVIGDATYTATYDSVVNKYVIMFLNEDSTLLQIDTLAYGAMPEYRGATPAKQATAQYTYTFNGWNNAIVSVTGDATYVATYVSTVNKYVVSFRDEDNALLQRDTLEYGALPAYRGQTPTKAATAQHTYSFAGWNPSVASVIGDATYTATYDSVVNKYVVMFLNEDSTLLQIDTLNYGAMPEYRGITPTKQATAQYTYTFNGWNNAIVSVTGNAAYLATYVSTTNKYLIIFQDEDGTPLQQDSVEYGALPAYRGATPTKQSTAEYTYTFAGWNPSVASVIGNATYTATYNCVVNKYVITFQNEDGTVLQRDTLNYGATPVYREANPTKESTAEATYTFAGWTPSITAVVEDVVYTATYDSVVNTYVVMFLNEDSTLLQIDTLEYGAMPEYRGEDPVKPNEGDYFYVFTGWEPEVVAVVGDAVYIATYESHGTGFDNVAEKRKPVKVMEDGKLYILMPDGTKYSATGKKVE